MTYWLLKNHDWGLCILALNDVKAQKTLLKSTVRLSAQSSHLQIILYKGKQALILTYLI